MKILYGLGNPGADDMASRHNAGWSIVEAFRTSIGLSDPREDSEMQMRSVRGQIQGHDVLLCWPLRFMNDQGVCLHRFLENEGVNSSHNLVVVHDDLDLPLGSIRLRQSGSPPSHNGLTSIVGSLGHDAFLRLRIGIETREARNNPPGATFVLDDFSAPERARFALVTDRAVDLLRCWVVGDIHRAFRLAA